MDNLVCENADVVDIFWVGRVRKAWRWWCNDQITVRCSKLEDCTMSQVRMDNWDSGELESKLTEYREASTRICASQFDL
jgi:hypothetical protein